MQNQKSHHLPRPQSAQKPPISTGTMAFAQEVAAEFEKLETGYRNGLYNFFGRALISYREFLDDPAGYKELLDQENIAGLREKPDLETTSRLVLYYLTDARNKPKRNTAGRYAQSLTTCIRHALEAPPPRPTTSGCWAAWTRS